MSLSASAQRHFESLNFGWEFRLNDEGAWKKVDVPHDFQIEQPWVAPAANEKADNIDSIKEGFNLIYNKLLQMMKRFDVEEIQAKGEEFNTDFHEAVTHFPAQKEEDKGKVIDVTEKGYKLKDKVIRYAKVVVGQ